MQMYKSDQALIVQSFHCFYNVFAEDLALRNQVLSSHRGVADFIRSFLCSIIGAPNSAENVTATLNITERILQGPKQQARFEDVQPLFDGLYSTL